MKWLDKISGIVSSSLECSKPGVEELLKISSHDELRRNLFLVKQYELGISSINE